MPIRHIKVKYGCRFKCGQSHNVNIKVIEGHEKICWNNPQNKTCKTCKHEYYGFDADDMTIDAGYYHGIGWYRECRIDNITEKEFDELYVNGKPKPKEHCDKWEAK